MASRETILFCVLLDHNAKFPRLARCKAVVSEKRVVMAGVGASSHYKGIDHANRQGWYETANEAVEHWYKGLRARSESLTAELKRVGSLLAYPSSNLTSGTVRCEVTGNPVGTDTWHVDHPCQCRVCVAWLASQTAEDKGEDHAQT